MPDSKLEVVKTVLDGLRSLVVAGFGTLGILFFLFNWERLSDLMFSVSRVKGFGLEVELRQQSAANAIMGARNTNKKLNKDEVGKLQRRARWIWPVLKDAQVLWVDDTPESNNNEMQLLGSFGITVRVARTTEQALAEILDPPFGGKFDLVITDMARPTDEKDAGGKWLTAALSACPVHWFEKPRRAGADEDLDAFNRRYNDNPEAGFDLLERIRKGDVPKDKEPDVIVFTAYDQDISSPCTRTITPDSYLLLQAVLDHLERSRLRALERFDPPEDKPVPPAAAAMR